MNLREKDDLLNVSRANPSWYEAMLSCARIILERTPKYAGDRHPYFAIAKLANDTLRSMEETLMQFISTKYNRLLASSGDFKDETLRDTIADLANYSLLLLGVYLSQMKIEDVLPEEERIFGPVDDRILIDVEHLMELPHAVDLESVEWLPRDGAEDFLRDLRKAGKSTLVFAAVEDESLPKIVKWLNSHNMYRYIKTVTNRKIPAAVYCPRFARQSDTLDEAFDHAVIGHKRNKERIEREESATE